MKIFLTNIPAFYKINLYNALAARMSIKVVFCGIGGADRNDDFVKGSMRFEHVLLEGSLFGKLWQMWRLLRKESYNELIVGGWENAVSLMTPFLSPKHKNACIIESSAYESHMGGVKGCIKRAYMRRIRRVYASGVSQARLARSLGFIDEIKLTGGCGLLNYIHQPEFERREKVNNFLYVGRLAEEKSLKLLIETFNDLPNMTLTIVGFGSQEHELKAKAGKNVVFTGAVNNANLPFYYQKADVFILPSKSEPWGLVVEEALNNGCPVIVSNKVGCREMLVTNRRGLIFRSGSKEDLTNKISIITNVTYYNNLRENISEMRFNKRAEKQVMVYVDD